MLVSLKNCILTKILQIYIHDTSSIIDSLDLKRTIHYTTYRNQLCLSRLFVEKLNRCCNLCAVRCHVSGPAACEGDSLKTQCNAATL